MSDPDSDLEPEDYLEAMRWLDDQADDPVLRAYQLREQSEKQRIRARQQCELSQRLLERITTRRLLIGRRR